MKTVLLTGHQGFVGRHVLPRLLTEGWEVATADIKSGTDCRVIFNTSHRFDAVVHCAANVGGRVAIDKNPLWVAQDFGIDSDFFQYVTRTKPSRSVYFSSSAAYPIKYQMGKGGKNRPMIEELIHPGDLEEPDQIYGLVKLVGERMAWKARESKVHIQVFRPFSGYGTDQDLDYPFPSFINRAVRREKPFNVWGPGTQVRDWIHIDDIVDAIMLSINGEPTRPLNLATGRGVSMVELADMVCDIAGYEPEIATDVSQPTGVMYRVGDTTFASHLLGFNAKITIEEGIERAIFFQERRNR